MSDNIDASLRLAALQSAQVGHINATTFMIVERAKEFYAFLSGVGYLRVTLKPDEIETKDPLPLAGHPPIETGDYHPTAEAVEAVKRKRRTKAEMEAVRATTAAPISVVHEALSPTELVEANAILAAQEATASTPAPAVGIAPDQIVVSVADVKKALHAVVEKDGLGPVAGGKLLAQFGVKRVSELDEKTFADFIAACNAAVAA